MEQKIFEISMHYHKGLRSIQWGNMNKKIIFMTRKLYWETRATEAEVEVFRCESLVAGGYGVWLNETVFHPKGGGQPSDIGWIGAAEIVAVEMNNDGIIHCANCAVPLGNAIARVNVEIRQLHSRLHSAGHVIGHVLESFGWQPFKAHHWPGEARVVFKPGSNAQEMDAQSIQRLCDQLIVRELPCKVSSGNHIREVGFGDLSPYRCGGTHVASSAELKELHVQSAKMKKGQLIVCYDIL
jgi:Ser-tRNA(Ala) deacylase AlaX